MAMEKTLLAINIGSASRKYAIYSGKDERYKYHFEKENGDFVVTQQKGEQETKTIITEDDFLYSTAYVIRKLKNEGISPIEKVGIRVVAPGTFFHTTQPITEHYIQKLRDALPMAPLHIAPTLAEIEQLPHLFPDIPILGLSDSAFHGTIQGPARLYALPLEDSERLGLYRYGYHGISVQSVVQTVTEMLGTIPQKTIVCHLGSGSSITALFEGKSVDTSMGFTPLEGIPMGTRPGDIDPGTLVFLTKALHLTPDQLDEYLNERCGLLGISGRTADIRELLSYEASGDKNAKQALDLFTYRIKKYIGAYMATLNGLDLLIFTATIGERSSIMRKRIVSSLDGIGIILDEEKNNAMTKENGFIEHDTSKTKIAVIKTNEMREMILEIQHE